VEKTIGDWGYLSIRVTVSRKAKADTGIWGTGVVELGSKDDIAETTAILINFLKGLAFRILFHVEEEKIFSLSLSCFLALKFGSKIITSEH